MPRTYWLDLFTPKTWQEFLEAGGTVSGFRDSRWATVRQIQPGDYLLCYLTQVSRWVGVLEVITDPYRDETSIWEDQAFPCRVGVKIVRCLTPENAVPILDLRDELSIFRNLANPHAWASYVRGSPARWKAADGLAVVRAIEQAL